MHQEDMIYVDDGCVGRPNISQLRQAQYSVHEQDINVPQVSRVAEGVESPLNHGNFAADRRTQLQDHQAMSRVSDPHATLYPGECRSRSFSPSTSPHRSQSPTQASPKLTSPNSHSATPTGYKRPRTDSEPVNSYHLMDMDTDGQRSPSRMQEDTGQSTSRQSRGKSTATTRHLDLDEQYEARVALVIQFAILFFCAMIVLAIFLAIVNAVLSNQVYWLIIALCLTLLVTLVLGLGCFLYQVLQEDDAPSVNQKHMPKWYRALRKIVRDELSDFREDWLAMCNNMYLLEDGATGPLSSGDNDLEPMSSNPSDSNGTSNKPKKRLGKSKLFKLVARPAALLASFRRKRRDKRRERKGQAAEESFASFPSTIV
jgi:hypothetical protein